MPTVSKVLARACLRQKEFSLSPILVHQFKIAAFFNSLKDGTILLARLLCQGADKAVVLMSFRPGIYSKILGQALIPPSTIAWCL